jgi:PTS system nitrogen regulatory IIA component
MKLTDFILKTAIIKELENTDKKLAIAEMIGVIKNVYKYEKIKVNEVVDLLMKREKIGSTGIGSNIAVPHIKIDGIKSVIGAFARSSAGIDFNAIDGAPVHLIFLILAPMGNPEANLQALKRIAQVAKQTNFCKFLREAKDISEIYGLFKELEEVLS